MSVFGGPGHNEAPDRAGLRTSLLAWFDAAGRDLPWRAGVEGRRDPYRVWISEVLLQQTQVARGLTYYDRFLQAFPTVQALALASEADVLKAWEGCGYYARARNLHRAARQVASDGRFPDTYAGWRALPGVGPYTAAAVTSLAFGEARAVNDGNVRRVLARLYAQAAPSETWVQAQADALLDSQRPGAWNEALMDLGATICTPRSPRCSDCPVSKYCCAFAEGRPAAYPAPKARAAVQAKEAVAVLIGGHTHAVLERRTGSLLGGLMGLPMEVVSDGETAEQALQRLCERLQADHTTLLGQVTHTMTHRRITLRVYAARAPLPLRSVADSALSRLDHKALELDVRRQAALLTSG
ncbi:A/G-specific adenine glycosylase [Deinococcus deserti]|uniref:Adenine DNA glycosylase n=1 Tax=Deinococcus deserti (strain DSM 17065 / CIP 109153 / LMG 22923 / VCD115) TaxID=546414 RepID=C1CYI4_DEIDV|nr:A/G-specific adenine glycosylase [Deinococcus deserti]ACO45005.1 putative A/G-specific adenine glycosylase [Deinococcus deserti VCD115]